MLAVVVSLAKDFSESDQSANKDTSDFNQACEDSVNHICPQIYLLRWWALRMMVKTVTDRASLSGFRSRIKQIIPTPIQFTNTLMHGISQNSHKHKYFWHLFGEEFLDPLVAETNWEESYLEKPT